MNLPQALANSPEQRDGTIFAVSDATESHGLFQAQLSKGHTLMVFGKFPGNDGASWRKYTFLLWEPEWLTAIKEWEWRPHTG